MAKLLHKWLQSSHKEKEDYGPEAGAQLQKSGGGVINSQRE